MEFLIKDFCLCGRIDLLNAKHRELENLSIAFLNLIDAANGQSLERIIYLVEEKESVWFKWISLGTGSSVAIWASGPEQMEAVSVVCAGANWCQDQEAIGLFQRDFRPSPQIFDELCQIKPPFISTFYQTVKGLETLKLCAVSVGFGRAFYTWFGTKHSPGGDRIRPE